MRRLPVVARGLLAALAACAPAQPAELTDAERVALADTISTESAAWKSAAERADANAVLSYYVPDAVIVRTDHSVVSSDSLKTLLTSEFRSVRAQVITPGVQRIAVLGRDVAAETAVGDWVATDTAGRAATDHFALSRVWVRRDGKWRILHSYLSVQPTPTPESQATIRK